MAPPDLRERVAKTHEGAVRAWSVTDTEPAGLNGIALAPAKPDYAKLVNPSIEEPPFTGQSAGIILVEPDGRVWTVSPKNEYGGYRNTFPKGRLNPGETPQQAAIRETWEESGLVGKIDKFLGDFERSTTVTRYYLGHRVGGAPWAMGAETERVNLHPLAGPGIEAHLRDVHGDETTDHKILAELRTRARMGKPGSCTR